MPKNWKKLKIDAKLYFETSSFKIKLAKSVRSINSLTWPRKQARLEKRGEVGGKYEIHLNFRGVCSHPRDRFIIPFSSEHITMTMMMMIMVMVIMMMIVYHMYNDDDDDASCLFSPSGALYNSISPHLRQPLSWKKRNMK